MNFEMVIILLILLIPSSIIIYFIVKEIRSICKGVDGLIKFIQIIFLLECWGTFGLILGYYLFFGSDETVPVLSLFLTIVVGFLGTIMGLYFSKETLETLKKKELTNLLKKIRKNLEMQKKVKK
ncbi:MAG: hypothetical protein CMH64_03720 [Nanoarchaeota archaeon]|nr:hypothetical protein [Nanoarchaeota archaeon]|tara:strand:- start:1322 stop:1693 length:372 start_codon:yes stop_codon:yes gene_type:complete